MELTAEMRNGEHGVFESEWQQLRIGSLHLASELVVLASIRVYTHDTLTYNNSALYGCVYINVVICQNNGLISLNTTGLCNGSISHISESSELHMQYCTDLISEWRVLFM